MSTLNPRAAQFQPSPLLQSAPPTVPASSKTSNGSRQKQRQPQSFSLTPAAIAGSKGPGISDKDWRASAANSTTKKSPLPDTLPNAVQDTTVCPAPYVWCVLTQDLYTFGCRLSDIPRKMVASLFEA